MLARQRYFGISLYALIGVVFLSGCGNSEGVPAPFKVASYNVGLVDGGAFNPPHAAARQPKILEALKAYDANALCLEEVWSDANIAAFKAALKDQ